MLGLIPDFQFSANPAVNPYVNPNVSMPPGMYQAGVYTTQPTYSGTPALVKPQFSTPDLGYWIAQRTGPVAGTLGRHGVQSTGWTPTVPSSPTLLGQPQISPVPQVYGPVRGVSSLSGNQKLAIAAVGLAALLGGFLYTRRK